MKTSVFLAVPIFFLAMLVTGCESEHASGLIDDEDVELVRVDGRPITLPMLEALMEIRGVEETDEEGMRDLLDELIRIRAMANAAEEDGMAEEARIRAERSIKDMETLYVRYVERMQQENPLSDEDVREVYDEQVSRSGDREFEIETIPFPDQSSALRALDSMDEQELSFTELATEAGLTIQPVGWINAGQVPDRFSAEMRETEEGEVVGIPLEFQNQWLLVRVTDIRALEAPAFEDLEEGIRRQLNRDRVEAMIDAAYDAADIEPMLPMDEVGEE